MTRKGMAFVGKTLRRYGKSTKKYFASQNIFFIFGGFFLEKYGQKVKSN
jgi:hypothetical protein